MNDRPCFGVSTGCYTSTEEKHPTTTSLIREGMHLRERTEWAEPGGSDGNGRKQWTEKRAARLSGEDTYLSTDPVTTWMWGGGANKANHSQLGKHQVFPTSSPVQPCPPPPGEFSLTITCPLPLSQQTSLLSQTALPNFINPTIPPQTGTPVI